MNPNPATCPRQGDIPCTLGLTQEEADQGEEESQQLQQQQLATCSTCTQWPQ